MGVVAQGRRKQLASRIYGIHLANATIRILACLWYAGLYFARHTYHYSSARVRQIKLTRLSHLWLSRQSTRRGFLNFSRVIPPLKTSWRLMKTFENKIRYHLTTSRNGGTLASLHLRRAYQYILKHAKTDGQLKDMCNAEKWKYDFRHVAAFDLASRAITKLSKMGRREGLVRRRVECHSFRTPSVSSSLKDRIRGVSFLSSNLIRKRNTNKEVKNVSWGELVHRRDERFCTILNQYNHRLTLYRKVPLKTISRLWGQFNQLELPKWLRSPTFHLYAWMFACTLEEAAVQDLTKFHNLSEFFRRSLKPGIRPIDGAHILTSPADGQVLHCGIVQDGVIEQVKGVTYSLLGFLGPLNNLLRHLPDGIEGAEITNSDYCKLLLTNPANVLYNCIIYLAPGDYHRFHSPADWTVFARRHFPGELFSVNPGIARWLQGVFSFNERAVYVGSWNYGFFSMTAVGATNVGSINVCFDKTLSTNSSHKWPAGCFYDKNFKSQKKCGGGIHLKKGEHVGDFNLGSTIVLLFEAPAAFQLRVTPGQRIKYGQGIGGCGRQFLRCVRKK